MWDAEFIDKSVSLSHKQVNERPAQNRFASFLVCAMLEEGGRGERQERKMCWKKFVFHPHVRMEAQANNRELGE